MHVQVVTYRMAGLSEPDGRTDENHPAGNASAAMAFSDDLLVPLRR
jgi:hypothetical protein